MVKTVYVIGVFDLFHRGHLNLLKRAAQLGDKLVVAVNGDELVKKYKRQAFYSEDDRLEIISALKYVDEAFIISDYDNKKYIKEHNVNLIVHGDDWEPGSYMEQIRVTPKFLREHSCELILLPYTKGISTSGLIEKIRKT